MEKTIEKRCDHCKQLKDETEFNWRFKALGKRHNTCRECMKWFNRRYFKGDAHDEHLKNVRERKAVAREVARQYVWDYLSSHPCMECGETDPMVLEFHYRADKDMAVSYTVGGGWSVRRIQEEIDKCDVLCANCHRRFTMKMRGWFRARK